MKTSQLKLKSSLVLVSFVSLSVWAKPVAQVTSVTGQVFVVTPAGATELLKSNAHIEDKSEIMVEEGASITVNDYYDSTYHLASGTHLKFFDKSVQLKRGKTWIQSQNSRHPLSLTTANGSADYWKSEFIAIFDQSNSRSQFLVVNGDVEVSNVLDRDMKYTVSAGHFTLVDPEVENGLPRVPTKVGLTSLNSALAEFKELPAKAPEAAPVARAIASVEEVKPAPKKGEIMFISSNGELMKRLPASVSPKSSVKKVTPKAVISPVPSHLTTAPIKFYGTSWKPVVTEQARVPASVAPLVQLVAVQKRVTAIKIDQEFGDSLKKEEAAQPQYSNELKSLIDDLKSY